MIRRTRRSQPRTKRGQPRKPKPGEKVVLLQLPPGLVNGLPKVDQRAITAIVGKPILLDAYEYGQAELKFTDKAGVIHWIWVDPKFIKAAKQPAKGRM